MKPTFPLAACAALALAACDAPADDTADDAAPAADATSAPAESGAEPAPAPTGDEPSPSPTPTATDDGGGTASVPAALRGRWGLVPADCTSTRGDAKGLITVSAGDIRFYESVARLGTVKQRGADSIRASWNFSGEGMNWTRDMSLTGQGGDTLVRREFGAEAMQGPLTYTKCG